MAVRKLYISPQLFGLEHLLNKYYNFKYRVFYSIKINFKISKLQI